MYTLCGHSYVGQRAVVRAVCWDANGVCVADNPYLTGFAFPNTRLKHNLKGGNPPSSSTCNRHP